MVSSSIKTPSDILCLYAARALRGFGDGFAIIILPVYLTAVALAATNRHRRQRLAAGYRRADPDHRLHRAAVRAAKLFLAGAGLIVFTG